MARPKRSKTRDGDEPSAAGADAQRDRRLRTPPPLTEGNEPFEGGEILDELEGELGGLLWNSLRSVTLWARADPSRRDGMAAPEAAGRRLAELEEIGVPEALAGPLATLTRVLSEPGTVESSQVAAACRGVAEWANQSGKLGTALAFLQAAALGRPEDAGLSYAVGRMARRHGEPTRAESWLQYAIAHARRNEDWITYTMAYAGLGNLYGERGNFPMARRALATAVRTARRRRLGELEAMASHDLFAMAAEAGRVREAEKLAASVAELYGAGHPRLPHLAHDLAYLWVERGDLGNALPVLLSLRPHIHGHPDRMLLVSSVARAAGGLREAAEFEEAWGEGMRLVEAAGPREGVSASLLNLARGAEGVGNVERAKGAARRALETATKMREGKQRLAAEALLERLDREPAAAPSLPAPRPGTERLVEQLVSYLAPAAVPS
ncbi:MAG: hypothetical protein JWM27_2253 [Gemmatimonadetes bacterium]|nr:hypothetical protein [Gemmatimonadota bacterium]